MITKNIKTILSGLFVSCGVVLTLSSCNDFLTIYPTDRIVGEDFWKKKSDVDQMVDGAYKSMLDYSVQERAIIWGAYRSDELRSNDTEDIRDNSLQKTLENIEGINLLPTHRYTSWAAFYKVINNCNVVLNHAPDVMAEDPEFTEGDYQVVKAQMLALRSLCYFYLVRAFRDVPYVTKSFETDTEIGEIEQSTPAEVLQHCLDDLAEAERYVMRSGAYSDWRDKGYFTRDAVHALMADIYLWRAAMTHNAYGDYQQVITNVDKVLSAKHKYYIDNFEADVTAEADDTFHLYKGRVAFAALFWNENSNSVESILEWQYNGMNNPNSALRDYYRSSGSKTDMKPRYVKASPLFAAVDKDEKNIYLSENDYRYWNNAYEVGGDEQATLNIRKLADFSGSVVAAPSTAGAKAGSLSQDDFEKYRQNWIVYRITDLMLMKAEALVETVADSTDLVGLKEAFDLVEVVNTRSMNPTASDKLKFENYQTQAAMESLVLAERERELCFEGKRWFDLMRYCYRHMTGVNINQRIAETNSWPLLYTQMLELVARKYNGSGGDAVKAKMKTEPFLYWPIQESEVKVNSLLKQNPVYTQEETISKN